LESVVHLADLELEVVETMIADRETIDASSEHVLVAADAAQAPKRVRWKNVNAGISREVRVDDRARSAGIDQHVRDVDRDARVRERRRYEREVMPKRQLHEAPGSPTA
jgi:hypothetical protein